MQRRIAVSVGRPRAVRGDSADELNEPESVGVVERGAARIVRRRRVRAELYQVLGGFGFFRLDSVHKRVFAFLVRRAHVCTAVDGELYHLFVSRRGGKVQRRYRRVGKRVHVRALLQKKLDYILISLSACEVQGRKSLAVHRVDIYPVFFEESDDDAFLSVLTCFEQQLFHLYLRRVRQTLYRNII